MMIHKTWFMFHLKPDVDLIFRINNRLFIISVFFRNFFSVFSCSAVLSLGQQKCVVRKSIFRV